MKRVTPNFIRKKVTLNNPYALYQDSVSSDAKNEQALSECNVLVINADHSMAKELTLQLSIQIPGCSILFAPTLALAKLMIKRRKIDLIVSSSILPDGSLQDLQGVLTKTVQQPSLLVFGDLNIEQSRSFEAANYRMASYRRFNQQQEPEFVSSKRSKDTIKAKISSLGADIRNDLNNPLQEIVAMVFVAQTDKSLSNPQIQQALDAIDNAAKNMSVYVNELEGKILDAL